MNPTQILEPLREGERIKRDEFERRAKAFPQAGRVELIDGVVHLMSPISFFGHGLPHANMMTWLNLYSIDTPGTCCGAPTSIRIDDENEPEPDAILFIDPERGGAAAFDEDEYVTGAPELVIEISNTTTGKDLNIKLPLYERDGIREYIVWRVEDQEIDWFVLRESGYERLTLGEDGIYRSEVFPGLWLDVDAIVSGDRRRMIRVLEQGLATIEHNEFVARLNPPTS